MVHRLRLLKCVSSVILFYIVCCRIRHVIVPSPQLLLLLVTLVMLLIIVRLIVFVCGVFEVCYQATVKTKEVTNESSPSVHENVPSGDRVS